jgi:hypothetical protein
MNENLYKQAVDHLKTPAEMNERTMAFLQKAQSAEAIKAPKADSTKNRRSWKKQLAIIAATFACLAMIVSAAAIINNMRYVPLIGFTDEDYAVYSIAEAIELGGGIVMETAMRVRNAETGQNNFMMIITSRTYGERDNPPDLREFEELTAVAADGTEHILKSNGYATASRPLVEGELDGIYVYDVSFEFSHDDFPDINEFSISTAGGSFLTEVAFTEDAYMGLYGHTEENGVSIVVRQAAENSRVIVYKIDDRNFDLNDLFGEGQPFFSRTSSAGIIIYDESGNALGSAAEWGGSPFYYDYILLLDERPEKISKAEVMGVIFDIKDKIGINHGKIDGFRQICADFDIPVPEDGEKIEYAKPLAVYDRNGITAMINSIERDGENLIIENFQYDIYAGANADRILAFEANFQNSDSYWRSMSGGGPNSWFGEGEYRRETTIRLTDENIKNKSVRLALSGFSFAVLYDWKINFGE